MQRQQQQQQHHQQQQQQQQQNQLRLKFRGRVSRSQQSKKASGSDHPGSNRTLRNGKSKIQSDWI